MTDTATLAAFALASLLIELTPGPNMAYLALLAATEGRKAGFAAVAGVVVGLALVGLAAALGLTALVNASPIAYQSLRWAGVAYLLWLAWQGWRGADSASDDEEIGLSMGLYFRRGVITNVLNPKAAVFYVTVLPGFLPPDPSASALIFLSTVYVGVATLVHGAIVTAAGTARDWLDNSARELAFRRIMALSIVGVAVWVIWKT